MLENLIGEDGVKFAVSFDILSMIYLAITLITVGILLIIIAKKI